MSTPLPRSLAALAAATLLACTACAQTLPAVDAAAPRPLAPPAAARDGAPGPLPPPPARADVAPSTTPVASGKLQRWLGNPNGEADGFLLADGTQVAFPPHLSAAMLQLLQPGDRVEVRGWRAAGVPMVRASRVTALGSGRSVVDEPPTMNAPPPREPRALAEMQAQGRITHLLRTDRGDVNGVLLDDGTVVRMAPHVGTALAPMLAVGQPLAARGWGSTSPQGRSLEAVAVGASAQDMRPLFAGPGVDPLRGGPGALPPGNTGAPRGPRGPVPPAPPADVAPPAAS